MLDFASTTAHEIVGPVDQISSLVALFVQRYRGKLDNDADTLLSHVEAARSRLATTALGLRKCFQITMAQRRYVSVDMNAALDGALHSLEGQVAACGAEIHADQLPVVEGDREQLILLLQVIVGNALKFRREGVPPRIVVSADPSQVFEVSDNGIGIDAQYREIVFEPFKRLNGHAYPGSGLGLTMAKGIVELHGGTIWIEPATEGTLVRFELRMNFESAL